MQLDRLTLFQFRNYAQAEFQFGPGVNALVGPNGSGKTNVLDAIHYLCLCKSYFGGGDSHAMQHGEQFFSVSGAFLRDGKSDEVLVSVKTGQKKTIRFNQKDVPRLRDHIGRLPLVMEAPVDQELVTGGSEERRRMMDSIICQMDQNYLDDLMAYNKVLMQRNALLKQVASGSHADASLWQIWDEQLVMFAKRVFQAREAFVLRFAAVFAEAYAFISGKAEEVGLQYKSSLREEDFSVQLEKNMQRDLSLQYTGSGTHKDDLVFSLNQLPLRRVGSQGQQKTFVLALKLAQFRLMSESLKATPILLLDDIFDKLDPQRVERLMHWVSAREFGQIFLTDTQERHVAEVFGQTGTPFRVFETRT
ncbi:MAG: DNA replication/repair protein RecF [Bacteroidota bacterium]